MLIYFLTLLTLQIEQAISQNRTKNIIWHESIQRREYCVTNEYCGKYFVIN